MKDSHYSIEVTKQELLEMVKTDEADEKVEVSIFENTTPILTEEEKELLIKNRGYKREELE